MKETLINYPLKNSRIVRMMKALHAFMLPLAFISMVGRKTFMHEYPILMNLMVIYLVAFLFIQIPFVIYFRYKYNKESAQRKGQFIQVNNI